ncbi:Ivy family c-type lysozyme inhibitor [Salinisphaera sp. T31B1]|uniref:Ivy family c-type lysozyme inhibitor n=1 Tax=Salinisphaera sp. T31B1 TaxID=727963 RepID=UPI00333FA2BD
MRVLLFSCLLFGVLAQGVGTAVADDTVYPSALLADRPALADQYKTLIEPIVSDHPWIAAGGTEVPVGDITLDGSDYLVLSSCKPHACDAQTIVTLMRPGQTKAVGAFTVNRGDKGLGPAESTVTWLGEPDRSERRFMAAFLFR